MNTYDTSPTWRKRKARRRRQQEESWQSQNGPVSIRTAASDERVAARDLASFTQGDLARMGVIATVFHDLDGGLLNALGYVKSNRRKAHSPPDV